MGNILVVEDDRDTRYILRVVLESRKHSVEEAGSAEEGKNKIEKNIYDAVILDRVLGDADGLAVLEEIKREDRNLPVIILTGHADVQSAVSAMKLGAMDYLVKPFGNEELLFLIEKAVRERKMLREFEALKKHIMLSNAKEMVFGESDEIKKVMGEVAKVAGTDLTVILSGPSGSGKEIWARQLHRLSRRNKNPFIALDCGTLPENLVESELFGYEKGAFTGADRTKEGLFEAAYGGTLFLDEISNLGLPVQAKLLRVLQERKIRRLGGRKDIPVNVRVIVASNTDLPASAKEGLFREDLYHRLNQFSVRIPSLKERRSDIPALSWYFLKEANRTLKKKVEGISGEAMDILKSYDWPGNVRELKNTITRAALMTDDMIYPEHLGFKKSGIECKRDINPETEIPKGEFNLKRIIKSVIGKTEREIIRNAMEESGGNKVLAAKILNIDRKSLYLKLKKYGLR